jgi:RNA polymerase sigma-70 factor, ECF subfamily
MLEDETDLRQAAQGDGPSWQRLMDRYRDRLRRMVAYRLDDRVQSRLDASDVVQDAFLDASKRLDEYLAQPAVPFAVWMRTLVLQRVGLAHRDHLGRAKRSVAREAATTVDAFDSSRSIAQAILDRQPTPSEQLHTKDLGERLREQLDGLDPLDREILMLRHFEHLTNTESAAVLAIEPATASQRYGRALRRLKTILLELGTLDSGHH